MARYLLLAPDAGGVPGRLKYVDDATAAPTVTDDGATRGVAVGSLWIDTVAPAVYVCVDASTGAAVWFETGGSGSGAPDDADYLVGTAHAGLSAEVVVGPTPGGELGGTWASPTVDATHSGSTHAATQAAAEATAAAALSAHEGLADPHAGYRLESADHTHATTGLQGGTVDHGALTGLADDDHPQYATNAEFDDHSARHEDGGADQISIAGLAGTSDELAAHLADAADAHDASAVSIADAGGDFTATTVEGALDELQADNEAHAAAADPHAGYVLESLFDAKGDLIAGSADNTPAKVTAGADDTILMADAAAGAGLKWVAAGTPSTQAFGDTAVVGTSDTFTRGDHKHAMMADPVTAHAAAADPHAGYRLESASGIAYVATPASTAINSITDILIATNAQTLAAGDQLVVEAWMTILNDSTATRNIILTLDFDGAFDIELTLPALAFSSTLLHPVRLYGVLDVRSTSLAYAMVFADMQLAAGIASGTDTSAAATHLSAKGWGTSGGNLTGSTTTTLHARSANATATQTLRLHSFAISKLTPTA
jgi:hypothetical protein